MLKIQYILINETLKEFYSIYEENGKGVIINHKGGAFTYDLFEEVVEKIEIDTDIKKNIWKGCLKEFKLLYGYVEMSKEQAQKIKEIIYKARLIEHYLNYLLKEKGKRFNYAGNELPSVIGLKESGNLATLREYKNELEIGIFSLSPDE